MNNPFSAKPFLFLLIPLLIGVLLQYYLHIQYWSIFLSLLGIGMMLLSYLISSSKQYKFRWVFGFGVILMITAVGLVSTSYRQSESEYDFEKEQTYYKGVVVDVPQEKAKTMAYKVQLPERNKQIVCYIEKDSSVYLNPGEEIFFKAAIQSFKNRGNPDEFDYVRYMYNLGFSGTAYLPNHAWIKTGERVFSLKTEALKCRQNLLDVYRSLGLNEEGFAVLSALTLGYRDALTDDLEQSFRTTGTVHILSVSGLHVGIIYAMVIFLLSFVRRSSKFYWLKPLSVIIFLWIYSYIIGLPSSVVRASTMLTVFCVAEIVGRRSNSIHSLYIAAFFMLLYNPFSLFDIGFQLSFLSVLSILYLHPKLSSTVTIKNKWIKGVWQLFMLSLVAQLATFPLCLYYFGTFPTYFFAANLIVVPLVSLIMYAFGVVLVLKGFVWILPDWSDRLLYLPVEAVKLLTELLVNIVRFIEKLPFSLIRDVNMSYVDLLLVTAIILSLICFWFYKKSYTLQMAMSFCLVLLTLHLYDSLSDQPNQLTIYNRVGKTDVRWNLGHADYTLTKNDIDDFRLVELNGRTLLILANDVWKNKSAENKFEVDYLLLTNDNALSLDVLCGLILPKQIIIDASLSRQTARRLYKECQKMEIPCHDVGQNGAYRVNF